MNVAVVGAGKMGLPLAGQIAARGASVTACDINPQVVDAINRGGCPIDEPGVTDLVHGAWSSGRLRATTDTRAAAATADVIVVIVPALLDETQDIDASALVSVSADISCGLKAGTLVIYETTVPVGATRRLLKPVLERSGLDAGRDFHLAFSPERVKSRYVLRNLTRNAKVVGGFTPEAASRAAAFYADYVGAPVDNVGTLEAAEFVKLAGMVYRDVNIGLSNQLARYAEEAGVDMPSLIGAINSDGEAAVLLPGIGVGGHCTPVYPHFLIRDSARRGQRATLAEDARRINDGQAAHALDRLERSWRPLSGARVLILGLAFRPGVKEHLLSPAFRLRDELVHRGAAPYLHDPVFSRDEVMAHGFCWGDAATEPFDVLVLNTAHDAYLCMPWAALRARGLLAIVDGRNVWNAHDVRATGLVYVGIGRPGSD
jgi:nucleotide sugar dehydrogenase